VCDDDCAGALYGSDGTCDDGGSGAEFDSCPLGTDCTDCGGARCGVSPPAPTPPGCVCNNECAAAPELSSDGICDDGGAGSEFNSCGGLGSDCEDCGERCPAQPPPPPVDQGCACSNDCPSAPLFASDGFCDDGGDGAAYSNCEIATDCMDCGPRCSDTAITLIGAALSVAANPAQFPASNVMDGDYSTLAATNNAVNAWVSVQLESTVSVGRVKVYNRDDSPEYMAWLSPFEVWVGQSPGATGTKCAGPVSIPPGSPRPFELSCGGATGSFVTVRLVGQARYLTLAELEVFGEVLTAAPPAASLPPPAACADGGPWYCATCVGHGGIGFEVTCAMLTANPSLFCDQMLQILFAGFGTTSLPAGLSPTMTARQICPAGCNSCG